MTHKLQPLDVEVFGLFQRAWIERCDEIVEDMGEKMSKSGSTWECRKTVSRKEQYYEEQGLAY
jgi:hypothetical protein